MSVKMNKTDAMAQIRILRNQGKYEEAFGILNQFLKMSATDATVLVEAVRLSIVLGALEQALKLFRHLQMLPDWQQSLPGEIWLRLKLLLPEEFTAGAADVSMADGASWCEQYHKDGKEFVYPANLVGWEIRCSDGTTTYIFESQCQCCREKHRVPVQMSFFIYREYLCPQCLATQYIDYELLKERVTKQDSRVTSTAVHRLDGYLRNLRNRLNFDTLEKNEFPSLCQYLNIDYAFMLNQIILRRLHEE